MATRQLALRNSSERWSVVCTTQYTTTTTSAFAPYRFAVRLPARPRLAHLTPRPGWRSVSSKSSGRPRRASFSTVPDWILGTLGLGLLIGSSLTLASFFPHGMFKPRRAKQGKDPKAQLAHTKQVYTALDELAAQGPLPQLWVFDLDYTLWPLWCDTHIDPPIRRTPGEINSVHDGRGIPVEFYPDVPAILQWLHNHPDVQVAAASRTTATTLARSLLNHLTLQDPRPEQLGHREHPAISLFGELEIYPGSKLTHFQRLHKSTNIPYSEMIFFDDEYRNSEVERQLGPEFVLVEDGLNLEAVRQGVQSWRRRQQSGTA